MSVHPAETGPLLFLSGDALADQTAVAVVVESTEAVQAIHALRPRRLLLRQSLDQIGGLTTDHRLQPDGIVLAGCGGLADLQAADVALGVVEAEAGLDAGVMCIIAELGASISGFLTNERLSGGSSRLSGLLLNEDALAAALGLPQRVTRSTSAPLIHARGRTVLQAADAGVPCFWSLPAGECDPHVLSRLRDMALSNGFADVAVHGTAQWDALPAAREID